MTPLAASELGSPDIRAPSRVEFLRALFGTGAPGQVGLWRLSNKRTVWLSVARLEDAARIRTTEDLYFTVALHDLKLALKLAAETVPARVRGSIESAIALPGLYGDFDVRGPAHKRQDLPPTFEEARALIARFPLRPTAILRTGYGFQAWWLLKRLWVFSGPEDRERAQRLLGRFHATLEGYAAEKGWSLDNVSDLARVLRLPETFNNKLGERIPVEFEEWCPENRYELSELEAVLVEETAQPPEPPVRVDTARVLAGVPQGQRDTELFRLACKFRRADLPREWAERLLCEAASRCDPPFPLKDALAKVASAYRYPAGGAFGSFVSSLPVEFAPLRELPPVRPEAPALPADLLPPALRPWLVDVAERMQVPLEFPAVPALVSLAAVVGRRVAIHPKAKDDWLVVPNLWGAIIARPGKQKTPTLAEMLKPVRWLEEAARQDHRRRLAEKGTKLDSLKAKEAALKDLLKQAHKAQQGRGPAKLEQGPSSAKLERELATVARELAELRRELIEPRLIVNDSTVEKLGELLADNPNGLLLERDELSGWLRSLEREDRKSDREFFLEAWTGTTPFVCDRIGRGTIPIPALCLSILGGIQPAKFARYISEAISGGYAADGLLQRFQLLVWPEDLDVWHLVDRLPASRPQAQATAVYDRLSRLGLPVEGAAGVPALHFAPNAQRLFYDWLTELEREVRSPQMTDSPAFEGHLAKYRSLMPSLALLFHLVEAGEGGKLGPVSLEAAQRAADWCDFLKDHARKVYVDELQKGRAAAWALAAHIADGSIYDGSTVRGVCRGGWSGLSMPELVGAGLAVLEERGWVRLQLAETGGRPSQVIRVNPRVPEVAP
jgi:putative DNA primase/helicase